MDRILEIVFRHLLRLLLLILVPSVISAVVAYMLVPHMYMASTSLWALQRYQLPEDATIYSSNPPSPAETQVNALYGLLLTHDFALQVANEADLASTLDPKVRAVAQERDNALTNEISYHVVVEVQSYNLFTISYSNRNPLVAQQVVVAVIHNFGEHIAGLSAFESQQLLLNDQSQLDAARNDASTAALAEARYIATHPKVGNAILQGGTYYAQSIDPQYALLETRVEQAQAQVQTILNNISNEKQKLFSQGISASTLFKVLDPPDIPHQSVSRMREFETIVGGAFGVGLLACILYIVIVVRSDRTLYVASELQKVTGYQVVMELPSLSSATKPLVVEGLKLNGTGNTSKKVVE